MASGSFAHLHVHTEYSMLDGASRVDSLVAAAAADGQPAVGITDHGNMYGVLPFYKACKAQGLTPVIGFEAYQAFEDRRERIQVRGKLDDTGGEGDGGKKAYYHLTLLAESNEGYKNLIQLASRAFLEGYYRKPKVDWELLAEHSRGVIATTGCLGGHVLQSLLAGRDDEALAKAARLQEIFGRDNLFVELQDHGIPEQHRTNPKLVEIAKRIGAPLLATNDSHYTSPGDAEAHDALLCVQTGALISQSADERFKFSGTGHYLKTATEMRYLFSELEVACDNSLWIAERANVEIEFGKPQLPRFPLPEGFGNDGDYLRHLTLEGARERWGADLPDTVVERLAYELKVIDDMGFSAYFLIVWDLIRHARESNIRVGPGRGSAAGCAVAYCLRITDLDPIRYDLLFERFLNPSRISMPDIDMDFDSRYRDEMIRYAAERYGRDRVAQIVTFSTIKARAAVRDAARVLGYPYAVGDKVAKAMPPLVMGRDTPLYACLEPHPKYEDGYKAAAELRLMCETDPDVKRVVEVAKGLEGMRRSDGIHAAAVVITKDPLTEYLPIQRKPEPGQDPESAPVITQYEMGGVEELGLLKMDFLGLRNLDVLTDTIELVKQFRGVDLDIDDLPLDDDETLALLRRGESIGVFQLEGGPMRSLMRSLAPTSFDDVAALVALYRPGPMAANMHNDYADRKNGRKPVSYLHPDAEEILKDTYGLCLTGDTLVINAETGVPTRLDSIDVKAGFMVQGVDDELRPAVRRVTDWVCNGERDVLELRLANGMRLKGTPDHPVLTERGWVQLGGLREDDVIGIPEQLAEPGASVSLPRSTIRLLAYLIADGSLSLRSAVSFTNSDPDLVSELEALVRHSFPSMCCSRSTRPGGVACVTAGSGRGNGGGPSSLLRLLRELGLKSGAGARLGGCRADDKFVPSIVFGLSDDDVGAFLAALWDCGGHVCPKLAHYKTVSARLAADVQLLLLRLGIQSAIYRATYVRPRDGQTMTAHQVTVYDGQRFAARISPYLASATKREVIFSAEPKGTTLSRREPVAAVTSASSRSIRSLCESTGVARSHLAQYSVRNNPRVSARLVEPIFERLELEALSRRTRLQWVQVAAVESAGRALVYDITVDEIHNFVANGMIVHNCVYQEQVMRVAQKFAGFSLAEADNLRKAMGKKKRDVMQKEKEKFVDGCVSQGYDRDLGATWFNIIEQFADYAFNRSHSFGYGLIAYQTAYLKAHYPVEYLAAILTSVKSSLEKAAVYLSECRALGIQVLVPDVNRSRSDFVPARLDDGTEVIPFGLSAVRNVGEGLVELIIAERERGGPYRDFYDFCDRVDLQVLNKRTIESLIKAGAFDSMGHPRRGLLAVHEAIIDKTVARRREHDMGVMTLFGEASTGVAYDDRPEVLDLEFDKRERLAFEKEMLGLYVSDHPLLGAEAALRRRTDGTLADAIEADEHSIKSYGGVITNLQRKWTRAQDLMAVFTLEDLQGSMEVMVFPKTMAVVGHKLVDDAVVVVKGKLDKREDQPKLVALDVDVFEGITDGAPPIRIRLPGGFSEQSVERLKALLSEHPGESQVFLHVSDRQVVQLPDKFCADASRGFAGEVRVLFGADCLL